MPAFSKEGFASSLFFAMRKINTSLDKIVKASANVDEQAQMHWNSILTIVQD